MQQLLQNLQAEHDAQLRAKDALIAQREHEAAFKQAVIDKLTHEMAVLKRLKFAATSERFASTPRVRIVVAPMASQIPMPSCTRIFKRLAALVGEQVGMVGVGNAKDGDHTGQRGVGARAHVPKALWPVPCR